MDQGVQGHSNSMALPTDEQIDAAVRRMSSIAIGLAWSYKWRYEKAMEQAAFCISSTLMYLKIPASRNTERAVKAALQESSRVYYVYIAGKWSSRDVPEGPQVYIFEQT
jgi:hypothetical protein